jgi:hypothetical protein
MKKYYLMLIRKGNSNAMIKLAFYYEQINNYDEAKKILFNGHRKR